jgi:ketopantoate reductase
MLLDVERGQPIEVEVIFGSVVRMAKERGIDMPVSGLILLWTPNLNVF